MDNQYEDEINLGTLLFKVCQRWRTLLVVAAVAAVAIGGTKLAMNIQGLYDEEKMEELNAQYRDTLASYEAEGEALERRMDENQRNLTLQTEYNDKSVLMKIDPHNEWVASTNLYIDTDYQVLPGSSIQNENPAYKITYAYYDYYTGGFYLDVMGSLTFDVGEQKYLKEVLWADIDANRYSITIHVIADTKEHCDELLKVAGEAFLTRQEFIESSLGEHSVKVSDVAAHAQINADREQYQVNQQAREKELMRNVYGLNEEYREWKKREEDIEKPIVDMGAAVKNGIKWIILATVLGGFLSAGVLFVQYMLSGRLKSAEEIGHGMDVLAELPVPSGKKKNAIDRLICKIFGVAVRDSEYDSRVEALALSLEKMLGAMQCEKGTIAFVGDIKENELKAFTKQVGNALPDRYKAVAAGNIIVEPAAAKAAFDADVVVLAARQDATMKKTLAQAWVKLSACKIRVLGAVLFGVESV